MKLEVTKGKQKGTIFALEGESASIGRSSECEIQLLDRYVSRTHAFLRKDSALFWTIQDLSSKQGIFVNGEKVTSWPLEGGDMIKIGRIELRVIGEKRPPKKKSAPGAPDDWISEQKRKLSDPNQWKGSIEEGPALGAGSAKDLHGAAADEPLPMPATDLPLDDTTAALQVLAEQAADAKKRCAELLREGQNALEAVWEKIEKMLEEMAAREKDWAERRRELEQRLAEAEKKRARPSKAERRLQKLRALLADEETADSSIPESADEENGQDAKTEKSNFLMFGDLDSKEDEET